MKGWARRARATTRRRSRRTLPVPVGLWSTPRSRVLRPVEEAGRFRIGYEADEGLALYKQCLRGVVFAPEGLLKLVFEEGSENTGVGRVISAASRHVVTHWLLARSRRRCRTDPLWYGARARGAHDPSVLEATYSAVTFHELRAPSRRAREWIPLGQWAGRRLVVRASCTDSRPQTGDVQFPCVHQAHGTSVLTARRPTPSCTPASRNTRCRRDVVDIPCVMDEVERDVNRSDRAARPHLGHDVQT